MCFSLLFLYELLDFKLTVSYQHILKLIDLFYVFEEFFSITKCWYEYISRRRSWRNNRRAKQSGIFGAGNSPYRLSRRPTYAWAEADRAAPAEFDIGFRACKTSAGIGANNAITLEEQSALTPLLVAMRSGWPMFSV